MSVNANVVFDYFDKDRLMDKDLKTWSKYLRRGIIGYVVVKYLTITSINHPPTRATPFPGD
jgi:hypothetical protein